MAMDPQDEPSSLNSQSEVAVLVAPNESNTSSPVIVSSSREEFPSSYQPDESPPNSPPPAGGGSRQISTGTSASSTPFSCKKYVTKRLPILKWLPSYKVKSDFIPDAISGVTVGLTAIPQSMAYANVAGLTPEYGLYSSFVSCFVYLVLGSCRQMTIGPTALMELLVFETCDADFPSCVILVGFWVGVIQFIMGLLKLGAVVSLISDPVTIGFVAGASLTISSSQIKSFFGLSGPKGSGFIGYIKEAILNIGSATVGDSCLGIACAILLLLFKNLKDYVKPSMETRSGPYIAKLFWFLSMGRNAIVVICASVLAASLSNPPFALTGTVKSGFPPVGSPDFLLPASHFPSRNETTNGTLTFFETWDELRTAPLMIAIISILQNVAIAKAFGSGQSIDATQEMIALGMSHIVASFFSAMPTAGSFTRSAVNEASGVKSPIGGIFTGLLVIFALSFLTRWFAYIPKASLAAVILCAVLPMIEYETIIPMWKVSKSDVLTALVTFLVSLLLGMEYGIMIGVAVSLIFYMIRPVRPKLVWSIESVETGEARKMAGDKERSANYSSGRKSVDIGVEDASPSSQMMITRTYILVTPEQGFLFPSVDAIRSMINKLALRNPDINMIVLDCHNMISMDYTSASALSALAKALKKTGKSLVFVGCQEEWQNMLRVVGLKEPQCYHALEEINREDVR